MTQILKYLCHNEKEIEKVHSWESKAEKPEEFS